MRIPVSPVKAVINSDRAIAEKSTGAWLPYRESSALQSAAQSNYRLKADEYAVCVKIRASALKAIRDGAEH